MCPFKLDLEKLHQGHYQTTSMLVNALQSAEVLQQNAVVIGANARHAEQLLDSAYEIALSMKYEVVRLRYVALAFPGYSIFFASAETPTAGLGINPDLVFRDHHAAIRTDRCAARMAAVAG